MLFFQIHIGDWETGTRLLSLEEKGVYLDLLTLYYKQEAPIMQMQCKRIARAYTLQEQESLNYVLEQFFEFDGVCYRNKRADEEIAKVHELSNARAKAAQARWGKGKKAISTKDADASDMQSVCKPDANAMQMDMQTSMQTQCKKDANQETNNQEYISTSFTNVQEVDSAPMTKTSSGGRKPLTSKFDLETLPEDWREYCIEVRPDLDPDRTFTCFKGFWTIGKGKGKLRSEKGWTQSWMTWVRNETETKQTNNAATLRSVRGPKEVEQDFNQLDYGQAGAF